MKKLILILLLWMFSPGTVKVNPPQDPVAASCNTSDVQAAINTATEGQTVTIPAGTCTWTAGVSIVGKGIAVVGAGSGRIVAYSVLGSAYTIGTGSKSIAITGYSPGFSSSVFTTGSKVNLFEDANDTNSMIGTVTGFSSGTLTLNVTSAAGTCGNIITSNCERWLVATMPASATILVNSAPNTAITPMFSITEDTSFHTNVSNIQIKAGTVSQHIFDVSYATGGQAVLVHDMFWQGNSNDPDAPDGNPTMYRTNSNRGVLYNTSIEVFPYSINTLGGTVVKDTTNVTGSWTSASTWGSADTDGQHAFYAETNDYHGMGYPTSTDDNGRAVFRYSLYDNGGVATHGADTSNYGQRYFEFYENTGLFQDMGSATFNFQGWFYLRGGSYVVFDNTLPPVSSSYWGTKLSMNMTVMNLQRNQGPDPCWGSGTHTAGQYYHAPRQVGFGRVTGSGTVNYPPLGINNQANDSVTYGGDSEPAYIWGNSSQPLVNVGLSDYGTTACTTPDSTSNYIVSGRDYFNGSTAKPGYTPETYPNPLITPTVPTPTINPTTGSYTSPQTVTITFPSGATCYYTTNGTTPTCSSTTYSSPFSQSVPATVGTIGCESGYANSSVATAVYSLPGSPAVTFSPTSLNFGNQVVSTTSSAMTITLTNSGSVTLTISGIAITGTNSSDFAQTNTCGSSVTAGNSCTISVKFTPSVTGSRTAAVSVTDNASGSPQTATLSGMGTSTAAPIVGFSPTSLTFSTQYIGTTSPAQTITLTNTGNATLTISSITLTGTNVSEYAQTNNCGSSLTASASCSINVTFTPASNGTQSADVSVTDNASGSPQTVALSGTGATLLPPANVTAVAH